MSADLCKRAESFIFDLKHSLESIWENYGDTARLNSLLYAEKEYGVMQREELKEIMELLDYLQKHVKYLSDDCQNIPLEFRLPDNHRHQKMDGVISDN